MSNLMEDANANVRRLVERVLSLPTGYMRMANQRADAGHQATPFGTVMIMNAMQIGTVARSTVDDGAGGLNEVLEVPTEIVVSVQFFKAAARPANLRGAQISSVVTTYTGVTNGGFDLAVDGGAVLEVTGLNLSAAADMNAVGAAIQAKLVALLAGVTVAWTGKRFIISSPTTSQGSAVGTAVAPTGGGAPTDVSTLLGLTAATGASPSNNASGLAKWNLEALELARRLRMLMEANTHGSYMQSVGLGFMRSSAVRDLSAAEDSAWEGRASLDLTFNVVAREVLPVLTFVPPFPIGIQAESPGGAIRNVNLSVTPH